MKLTLGEMTVLIDTLRESLSIVNFGGYTHETRKALLHRINNDESLVLKLETEDV